MTGFSEGWEARMAGEARPSSLSGAVEGWMLADEIEALTGDPVDAGDRSGFIEGDQLFLDSDWWDDCAARDALILAGVVDVGAVVRVRARRTPDVE